MKSNITRTIIIAVIALSGIGFFSCAIPNLYAGFGDIAINTTMDESAISKSIEQLHFIFSGKGPGGAVFSIESIENNITIDNLITGEWEIEAAGYNSANTMVASGKGVFTVTPSDKTAIELTLRPIEGTGSISINASWNGEYTINPSAETVITSADGAETHHNMTIKQGNTAELEINDLQAGFYSVSIKLYDNGILAAGSVYSINVISGDTAEVVLNFDNLNKIGERIVINEDNFTIGWEADSPSDDNYRIYARQRGEYDWNFIQEIPAAPNPSFEINTSILSYGIWEFAVSSIDNGIESELHTSMDNNAVPASGWYIDWIDS